MKKDGIDSVCGVCGKLFYLPPSHRTGVNFCSYKCKGIAQSTRMKKDLAERFWAKVQKTDGCWLWIGALLKTGYGSIRVNHKAERAHRVAYELVNGPIPSGMLVLHSCDNPQCVNPSHLRVGTKKENMQDAIERKLAPTGEKSPKSKLTTLDVVAIRAAIDAGVTGRYLAKRFSVSESTISVIKNRKAWMHGC